MCHPPQEIDIATDGQIKNNRICWASVELYSYKLAWRLICWLTHYEWMTRNTHVHTQMDIKIHKPWLIGFHSGMSLNHIALRAHTCLLYSSLCVCVCVWKDLWVCSSVFKDAVCLEFSGETELDYVKPQGSWVPGEISTCHFTKDNWQS